MKEPANKLMDMLERGQTPTVAELRKAGLCLLCSGYGYIWIEKTDENVTCTHCGGDGLLRKRKI